MGKKKIVKCIVWFIAILLILFIIYFIRNFIIINKIAKKAGELTNYSVTIKYTPVDEKNGEEFTIETYCTDEKTLELGRTKREANNTIVLFDKNTRIVTSVFPNAMIGNTYRSYGSTATVPFIQYETIGQKIKMAILAKISTKTINGEKCYVISDWRSEYLRDVC